MNRFFTLIVTCILLMTLSSFFNTNVTIKMEMPDVIEAGTEIKVDVVINKGKLAGYARFQQELPYGFTAVSVNSANADFSFQDQKIRLIWLRLPDDDEITISYNIIANERLTGNIDLNGRFSYIDNNERKSVDLMSKQIAVTPSPNVAPEMVVNVRDYAKIADIESAAAKSLRVACLRQTPVWMAEDNIFLVTLLVNKDAIQKYAKIEETVPAGYTAANIDSKGGIFTYKDQSAKFIWMDLPAEPYFTVTYKLIPEEGTIPDPSKMQIAGNFSYMSGNETVTAGVVQRPEKLAGLTQSQVDGILRGIVPERAKTQQPVLIADNTEPAGKKPSSGKPEPTPSKSVKPTAVAGNGNDMLAPESGVYYRVQIAAGHKPLNAQRYFRKHKLDYSVMKELHDGWFKYSIGSFAEYKDARDYRVHLSNTTTLNDAFIAAYNNGKRITVQDALMALNQRWYK